MSGVRDARRAVDVEAQVVVANPYGVPGVEADPDAQLDSRLDRLSEAPLDLDRGRERVCGRLEDREERVSAGRDLSSRDGG